MTVTIVLFIAKFLVVEKTKAYPRDPSIKRFHLKPVLQPVPLDF